MCLYVRAVTLNVSFIYADLALLRKITVDDNGFFFLAQKGIFLSMTVYIQVLSILPHFCFVMTD